MSLEQRRFVTATEKVDFQSPWTLEEWLCRSDVVPNEELLMVRANMEAGFSHPFHTHPTREEMIYIIDGAATLRLGNDELQVGAGDVIACPPGSDFPHQLINTGDTVLTYLVVSTMDYPDISQYPDSNKIGAYANTSGGAQAGFRALYVRDKNVNYYDGEDGKEVERILTQRRKP